MALRTSTSGRKGRDAKKGGLHALGERMERDAGAYNSVGGGGSEKGKARPVRKRKTERET